MSDFKHYLSINSTFTIWKIEKETDEYLKVKASRSANKKNGEKILYENINYTCWFSKTNEPKMCEAFKNQFAENKKIQLSGTLKFSLDKRNKGDTTYTENLFVDPQINVVSFSELKTEKKIEGYKLSVKEKDFQNDGFDEDMPF